MICSKLSDADKRNIISTKESDLYLERADGAEENDLEDEENEEDEEDYSVGRGGSGNTTLRKSAAYTLA